MSRTTAITKAHVTLNLSQLEAPIFILGSVSNPSVEMCKLNPLAASFVTGVQVHEMELDNVPVATPLLVEDFLPLAGDMVLADHDQLRAEATSFVP